MLGNSRRQRVEHRSRADAFAAIQYRAKSIPLRRPLHLVLSPKNVCPVCDNNGVRHRIEGRCDDFRRGFISQSPGWNFFRRFFLQRSGRAARAFAIRQLTNWPKNSMPIAWVAVGAVIFGSHPTGPEKIVIRPECLENGLFRPIARPKCAKKRSILAKVAFRAGNAQ